METSVRNVSSMRPAKDFLPKYPAKPRIIKTTAGDHSTGTDNFLSKSHGRTHITGSHKA